MTKVLVTGANGHVGAHTVRSLLARDHEVIAMVRKGADLRALQGLNVEYRTADVLDTEAVYQAITGVDVVIHSAAVYAIWAKNPDEIVAPSVMGTRNVFDAAKAAGVRRIVYTSSIAAVGFSESPDQVRTPEDWNDDAYNAYFVAKVRGERDAVRLSEAYAIDTVRLCPAIVMGPLDYKLTPSMKMIGADLVNGSGVTYTGGTNLVHVRDVGDVHALAVECGQPGSRYIIGGENLEMAEAAVLVEKWTGVRPRHLGVGRGTAMILGSVLDGLSKVTGKQPQFSSSLAHEHSHRWSYFDSSETYREFGYAPTSADETLHDAMRWLLYMGEIRPKLSADKLKFLAPDPTWTK